MVNLRDIKNIQHHDFFNQISNAGGVLLKTSWSENIHIPFTADYAIIRQVTYNTLSTTDPKIYNINSSLNRGLGVATFPGSNSTVGASIAPIIVTPNQIISLHSDPVANVSFNIMTRTTDGTNEVTTPGFVVAQSSSVSICVDFIELHKK